MAVDRDPYTGFIPGVNAPRPPLSPEAEERVREIVREEIEAALVFFEEQASPSAFIRHVKAAMIRKDTRLQMEGLPR